MKLLVLILLSALLGAALAAPALFFLGFTTAIKIQVKKDLESVKAGRIVLLGKCYRLKTLEECLKEGLKND